MDFVDGLLVVRALPGVRQTLEDARENVAACEEILAGARPLMLLDLTHTVPLDPEVRHYYTGAVVVRVCSALALVVEASPLGRMIGNVYLRVSNPAVPTRVFDREAKAIAWLRTRRIAPHGPAAAAAPR